MAETTNLNIADNENISNKKVPLLTGVIILALGVVLTVFNKMITGHGVVVLAGILFLLTGIINIVVYVTRHNPDGSRVNRGFALFFGWLVSCAAMILGLCMLVFSDTFSRMIPFIFGLLILFGALVLTFSFIFGVRKVFKVPGWVWIFPLVMVGLGIVTMTLNAVVDDSLIMILTGVSMIIFGVTGMIVGIMLSGAKRQARREELEATKKSQVVTHDVKAVEVSKEQ